MHLSLRRSVAAGLMVVAIAAFGGAARAQAQKQQQEQQQEQPQKEEQAPPENPVPKVAEKINTMLLDLVKGLKPEEQKHFFLAYSNYNLQGTVSMVQGDVERAITACGKNNPDMKPDLDKRYAAWRGAIDPVIKNSKANLENMLKTQKYANKKDILAIFAEVDNARKKAQSQIEKIPVTTPEACEYLMNKMNETQESMISLLRSTLLSVPQAYGDEEIPPELASPVPEEGDPAQDPPPAAAPAKETTPKKAAKPADKDKPPAQEAPAKNDAPAKDVPAKDAPTKDAPAGE